MGSAASDREWVRRHGLIAFAEIAWEKIEPKAIIIEPHMGVICSHYEAAGRGEIKDLVVEVPPGTSKSTLTSILWPAWDWTINPWRKWLHTSYSEDISHDFSRRTLDLIQSPWYLERWPDVKVKGGGRAAAGMFWLESNGRRVSTMMSGQATGVHADILVADDPHKPEEIKKGGEIAKKNLADDWKSWTGTFSSRTGDAANFVRVIIAQRLHEDDISGRMKKSHRTTCVHLPMEFVPKRAMSTKWGKDWRTVEGELLCPKRYPAQVIEAKKDPHSGMSKSEYAAQFQQQPAPEEGNLFQEAWFSKRISVLPPTGLSNWFISCDATFKDTKSSDFVGIGVWAMLGKQPVQIHLTNKRLAFVATCEEIRRLKATYPQVRAILVEDKANGSAIIDTLKTEFTGLIPVEPRGSKYARAVACTPMLKGEPGVAFVNGPWMEDFVLQCKFFPMASHDDMVDQMTQALDYAHTLVGHGNFLDRMRDVQVPGPAGMGS